MVKKHDNNDLIDYFEQLIEDGRFEEKIDKFINDDRIPDFVASTFLTDEQWAALIEEELMTQELFDSCLNTCHQVSDGVMFQRIVEQFPNFIVNFDKELREKYKQEHDKFKKEYLERFGEDAQFFLD